MGDFGEQEVETQNPEGLILGPGGLGGLHVKCKEKSSQSLRLEQGLVELLKTTLLKYLCIK